MIKFLSDFSVTRFGTVFTSLSVTLSLFSVVLLQASAEPVRVYHNGMQSSQVIISSKAPVIHKGHVSSSNMQVNSIASRNVSMPSEPVNYYYLKPYQAAQGKPVRLGYYAPDASSVMVEASNDRTNKSFIRQLNVADSGVWHGQIPTTFFKAGDPIQIMFTPVDKAGLKLGSPEQVTSYRALSPAKIETSQIHRLKDYIAQQ